VSAQQATVARRVVCNGIGLHGGGEVEIAVCPGGPNTGIVFVVDSPIRSSPVEIKACAATVQSSSRATSLSDGAGVTISTVEHLLATLFVLRLDNIRVEVRGAEIPMLDGSALPFVEWIREAGRVEQSCPRLEFDVDRPFEFVDGNRSIRIEPHYELWITYAIEFDHPAIGRQCLDLPRIDERIFEKQIAGARTFGFAHEIESLRAAGLAIGGSFDNALILDDERVLNETGLRWPDEFVRHKVIDLLGDLSLFGVPVNGHIHVERGGHSLHHRLVHGLLEQSNSLRPSAPAVKVNP